MFYATYSCFKYFGRPCVDIPWYNTIINITTQKGVVIITTGAVYTIINAGATSAAPPRTSIFSCDSTSIP